MAVEVAVADIGAAEGKAQTGGDEECRLVDASHHGHQVSCASDGVHLTGAVQAPTGGQLDAQPVCRSAAGYYVGTVCECGPYTRESYYMKPDEAKAAFDRWLTGDFVMARGNGV